MELSAQDLKRWPNVLPFIQNCATVFREHLPDRYAAQQRAADDTNPKWIIDGTCFSTVTVNRWDATHKARTPVHRDNGDLPTGFGVIGVLRRGDYTGGELVFPKFRVGVDLHEGDVLLADVHELHGNAPITGISSDWERIATISYFRTAMLTCPKGGM